jgi:hypothetical protein
MKKVYTLIAIGALSLSSTAQVVIQASELNPVIGETFTVKAADWIPEGNWGTNVTWDHSAMQETGTIITIDNAAGSGSFPSTNITQHTTVPGQTTDAYYEMNATGQYIHGVAAGPTIITYQDPAKVMAFVLDNAVYETDNFSATFTSGGFAFVRAGTSLVFADAHGTLITPEGTFTDVIRVRNDMNYTDTYSGGTITYFSQTYSWYKAGVHFALASVAQLSTDTGAPTQYSAQYLTNVNLGVNPNTILAEGKVFPNPTNGQITIEIENFQEAQLTNVLGETVKQMDTPTSDLSELPAGVYFLEARDLNGLIYSEKVVLK